MKLTNEQAQAIQMIIEQNAELSESLRAITDPRIAADILENAAKTAGMAVDKRAIVNWLNDLLSTSEQLSDDKLDISAAGLRTAKDCLRHRAIDDLYSKLFS